MKAITICQPYAHLIAIGEKRVENRSWATEHRGPLAIHAGKSRKYLDPALGAKMPGLVFGAVIATCQLYCCVPIEQIDGIIEEDPERFGWLVDHKHVEGPICWVLENVYRKVEPFYCRGERGLWDVNRGKDVKL